WYALARGWMDADEATLLHADLLSQTSWETRPVRGPDGQETVQPRLVGWAGSLPYTYSGQTLPPRPPTPALAALWARIESASGRRFNHAVVNRYRNGFDHMGLHTDREPQLGEEPLIAALSLGATRTFRLEWKYKRRRKRTLALPHGSLLLMGGSLQKHWRHAVPRAPAGTGERLNVTFRWLYGPPAPEPR
ncbi:MAG: alpha-ketoglutarate-dependent dioxygenase AlkB, partial [Myxococcota bacterium]|nr:alpha-ketoglutarate-dependent dioxygenase AlkB [Myxococcota bacterium]